MTIVKLAAPALAWLAFWSAAPADARVFAPILGAPSNAAPMLVDDKDDDRTNDQRGGETRDGEDDEDSDDLDMMDMGDDDGDDESGDRSDDDNDDNDDRRERDGDRRN